MIIDYSCYDHSLLKGELIFMKNYKFIYKQLNVLFTCQFFLLKSFITVICQTTTTISRLIFCSIYKHCNKSSSFVKFFPLIQSNRWILVPLVSIIWLDFEFGRFLFPYYTFFSGGYGWTYVQFYNLSNYSTQEMQKTRQNTLSLNPYLKNIKVYCI